MSCGFLFSDYGVFKCPCDTAQEDGIFFHQCTGPGSELNAPVYRWTTTQHTGPAALIKYLEVSQGSIV